MSDKTRTDQPEVLTLDDAAKRLDRGLSTLYRWRRAGLIRPVTGDLYNLDHLREVDRTMRRKRGRPPGQPADTPGQ